MELPGLPEKMSDALALAVEGLQECEQKKDFKIDMHRWYFSRGKGICRVCLAGSLIAKLLAFPVAEGGLHPDDFIPEQKNKIRAIDELRKGNVELAYKMWHFTTDLNGKISDSAFLRWLIEHPGQYKIPSYHYSHDLFKRALLCLADTLRKFGV